MRHTLLFFCLVSIAFAEGEKKRTQPRLEVGSGVAVQDGVIFEKGLYSFDLASTAVKVVTVTRRMGQSARQSIIIADCKNGTIIVIVATPIRLGLPRNDSLLSRQKPRLEAGATIYGQNFELSDRKENGRRVLEYTLLHESYDRSIFPFGSSQKKKTAGSETIGIHRLLVRSQSLIEIAIVRTNLGDSTAKFTKDAKAYMTEIVKGIKFP